MKNDYYELVSSLEVVAEKVIDSLEEEVREEFHQFLIAHTDIVTKKV